MSFFDLWAGQRTGRQLRRSRVTLFEISLKHRFLAALAFAAVIAVTGVALQRVPPKFKSTANLLVLLSDDYTLQPIAGQGGVLPQVALDRDAYMSAESEILQSREVIEAAVKSVGLDSLYPNRNESPGTVAQFVQRIRGFVTGVSSEELSDAASPLSVACDKVEKALSIDSGHSGNVITVSYENTNSRVATEFLAKLIDAYLLRRETVFADRQVVVLARAVQENKSELDAARSDLVAFRDKTKIVDFSLQRELLLKRLDNLNGELQSAQVVVSETDARRATVLEQLMMLPSDSVKRRDGSTSTVRHGTTAEALELDANKLDQELSGGRARLSGLREAAASLSGELTELNRQEAQFATLKLRLDAAERGYSRTLQALNERQSVELVASARHSNVKLVDGPSLPDKPTTQRLLIAVSGAMLAGFSSCAILILGWLYRARERKETMVLQAVKGTREESQNNKAA